MEPDPKRRGFISLFFITLSLFSQINYKAPEIIPFSPNGENGQELVEIEKNLLTIQDNTLQAIVPLSIERPRILASRTEIDYYQELIKKKYPEKANLLICLWERESSKGRNMYGDFRNGEPMAFGHFQVWLKYHPISYECSMDLECSLQFTAEMIEKGYGRLWTPYNRCKKMSRFVSY